MITFCSRFAVVVVSWVRTTKKYITKTYRASETTIYIYIYTIYDICHWRLATGVRCKPQVGVCCGAVVTRVALRCVWAFVRETHVARWEAAGATNSCRVRRKTERRHWQTSRHDSNCGEFLSVVWWKCGTSTTLAMLAKCVCSLSSPAVDLQLESVCSLSSLSFFGALR